MRIFKIDGTQVSELDAQAPIAAPSASDRSYLWVSLDREEFKSSLPQLQALLQSLCGASLLDLHVSDLQSDQLPSHFDYTSQYDLLVFRRLAATNGKELPPARQTPPRSGPPVLRRIDTRPVGFAVFDRVLLSVHPEDGAVRDFFAAKLRAAAAPQESGRNTAPALDARSFSSRLPPSPSDLMLRILNHLVDAYLDLRRELTRQLDHWQAELIDPRSRFTNWSALMDSRQALYNLDEICEDQRAAIQDWIDALEALPPANAAEQQERELLMVRSRDLLEHIERVVHHVRRLENNAETAVQMHFSVQSHRANDIMRVLTVLTAIFLPLNLIAGIFGMNFEFIPLVHKANGFWIAMTAMGLIAAALALLFWRKRYLARTR